MNNKELGTIIVDCAIDGDVKSLQYFKKEIEHSFLDIFNNKSYSMRQILSGCEIVENQVRTTALLTEILNQHVNGLLDNHELSLTQKAEKLLRQNRHGESLFLIGSRFLNDEIFAKMLSCVKNSETLKEAFIQTDKSQYGALMFAASAKMPEKRLAIALEHLDDEALKISAIAQTSSQGVNIMHILTRRGLCDIIKMIFFAIENKEDAVKLFFQKDQGLLSPFELSPSKLKKDLLIFFYVHNNEAEIHNLLYKIIKENNILHAHIKSGKTDIVKSILASTKDSKLRDELILKRGKDGDNALAIAAKYDRVSDGIRLIAAMSCDEKKLQAILSPNNKDRMPLNHADINSEKLYNIYKLNIANIYLDRYKNGYEDPAKILESVKVAHRAGISVIKIILTSDGNNIFKEAISQVKSDHIKSILNFNNPILSNERLVAIYKDSMITNNLLKFAYDNNAEIFLLLLKNCSKKRRMTDLESPDGVFKYFINNLLSLPENENTVEFAGSIFQHFYGDFSADEQIATFSMKIILNYSLINMYKLALLSHEKTNFVNEFNKFFDKQAFMKLSFVDQLNEEPSNSLGF